MGFDQCRGAFGAGGLWGSRRHGEQGGSGEPGGCGRTGKPVEQVRAEQAGVTRAAFRIEDLEVGTPARRAVAIASDLHRTSLADDIPAEPDPARAVEFQAQPARLLHRGRERPSQGDGLQHQQQRPRPARERGEPAQPVPHPFAGHRRIPPLRQVQDQQVHRPRREQGAREDQRLLEIRGREDHQPFRPHAARDGLHRIEGAGEIQPGHDGAAGLRLRRHPQRERRPSCRGIPTQRDRGAPGQAARGEDRIERREAGGDHAPFRVRGNARTPDGGRGEGRGHRQGR